MTPASLLPRAASIAQCALKRAPASAAAVAASSSASAAVRCHTSPARRSFVSPSDRTSAILVDDTRAHRKVGIECSEPELIVLNPVADSLGFKDELEGKVTRETVGRPIYLDAQATTPVDPRVLDVMLPYMTNQFGNPHSRTHAYGWESEKAAETAREHIAALINASPKDIIFTSGATESNNMSIKGVARFYRRSGKKHIITLQTEHKCVLDSCRVLQDEGFDVTYLPVKPNGVVDLQLLEKSIRPDTCLISIMTVNNEIGTIQPVAEIGKIAKRHKGVFFHTDGAQAVGKIPMDVDAMNIDLMSISAHKIYGPKGIGACYIRRRPRVRIEPIINGGGQERGLRSGTLAPGLAVGFGEACRLAKQELQYDHDHVSRLSKRLNDNVSARVPNVVRNGDPLGYPGCVNISFAYVEGESLLMALKDIALSSGSACTSASLEPSYVLRALGAEEDMAHSSIRFGIGRFTTEAEIDFVTERIVQIVNRLREMSPLWEMVQEGIDLKSINWSQH